MGMNSARLKQLLKRNTQLWWWMKKEDVYHLSPDSIVEGILNYGFEKDVKELIEIFGEEQVAKIFAKNSQNWRHNYLPLVKNYFDLYFQKHVSQYPFSKSN